MIKKQKLLGPFYCLMAAVIWGLSFVAQSVGKDVGTFTFNAVRMALGFAVLLPYAVVRLRRGESPAAGEQAQKAPLRTLALAGLCCGIPLCIGVNLQQHAFNYLEVGKVGFITALYMLLVPVFGLFLHQRVRLNVWLGVGLGMVGLYFISIRPGGFSVGTGELITVIGAVAFAAHILVVDHFCRKVDTVALSCAQFLVTAVLSGICMLLFESPSMAAILAAKWPLLYTGIMSCAVAFTAQVFGQKYAPPAVASLLLCTESVFSVLFGWILLDQMLTARELFGCGVMFAAVVLTQIPTERFHRAASPELNTKQEKQS
ncbi:MAG: DMT family transporter [Clostridia bacterium]|nr:DMT family transporter [Clostridia bacterium]